MKTKFLSLCCLFFVFYSCNKDESDKTIKISELSGYVQKGPFLNGSAISISELNDHLSQTGRLFSSTIADNSGKFEINDVEFASKFVSLRADGFYFNENSGEISSAQLTLNAIVDISDESSVNVNLLTHIEKSRIEFLVNQKGLAFGSAKSQAISEVLNMFSLKKGDIKNSECLNIVTEGDDNAILFAISVIIQGFRTTADMSELLANIITDIKEDGVLSDPLLGSKLIDDAKLLDLAKIRRNMEKRYSELGLNVNIPNFEKYVKIFIDSTSYKPLKVITYPVTSNYGTNILNDAVTQVSSVQPGGLGVVFSMAADIPVGMSLKIVLKNGVWYYTTMPSGPVNWNITTYSFENKMQTFTAIESGKSCDLKMSFYDLCTFTIEFYENNSLTPTKTKSITVTR